MRVIIAGSRTISPGPEVISFLVDRSGFEVTEVVSGCARGVDTSGEKWALQHKIRIKQFKVTGEDWDRLGKSAGLKRNTEMAKYADALIVIWDGKSPGSKNMIRQAFDNGLKIYEARV